jgi:hypothetical protein
VDVANGYTIPQMVALLDGTSAAGDPFVPRPGERRVSKAEHAAILERRRRRRADAASQPSP